ncbi:MAG: AraC family carnitine catabolism transcriptional activator [Motiliproteus sp.]
MFPLTQRTPLIADDDGVFTLTFLLLPEYGMVSLLSAIEPLRIANRLGERQVFRWQCLSASDEPVMASNGMALQPCLNMNLASSPRNLFVNASFHPEHNLDDKIIQWLRRLNMKGYVIGALDTGCYLLAKAKILENRRITLHWEAKAAFKEQHSGLVVTNEIFEIDGKCITCAGGTAASDMVLHLISGYCGSELAKKVCDQLVKNGMREQTEQQTMGWMKQLNIYHPKLLKALELMTENIEAPLSSQEIANLLAISMRQLERLFTKHCESTPSEYYLHLRIDHARQLLLDSSLSISEIAFASGFSSVTHFSRSYRKRHGTTASAYRLMSR